MTPFEQLDPLRGPLPELPTAQARRDLPDGRTAQQPGEAHEALEALNDAWQAYEAALDQASGEAVVRAVARCEALGIRVDPRYAAAVAGIDIDAATERREAHDRPLPVEVPDDPLQIVPGMVPIYNPMYGEAHFQHAGETWRVPSKSVRFVDRRAADRAVGQDNSGGSMSRLGVRRLYGLEPRFETLAEKVGLSLREWVENRNRDVIAMAELTWERSTAKAMADEQRLELERQRLETE